MLRKQEATSRVVRRPEALSVPPSGGGTVLGGGGKGAGGRSMLAPPTLSAAPRTPQEVPPVTII